MRKSILGIVALLSASALHLEPPQVKQGARPHINMPKQFVYEKIESPNERYSLIADFVGNRYVIDEASFQNGLTKTVLVDNTGYYCEWEEDRAEGVGFHYGFNSVFYEPLN